MKKPGVGLAVILRKESGLVLLGKRKGSHDEGTWAFPGGYLEKYEDFEDCILREMKEETGLVEGQFKLLNSYPVAITNDLFVLKGKHYVTLYFRADYIKGEPKVMEFDKNEEWKWFDWENLPKPYELFLPIKNLKRQFYNPF